MIRNEREYREAQRRIKELEQRMAEDKRGLESSKLGKAKVRYGLNPMRTFHQGLVEEAKAYERLKAGHLPALASLEGLGRFLVEARIASGVSQRDLAGRLGVHESQVSHDENDDYHGITVARAERILAALGVGLRGQPVRLREPRRRGATAHLQEKRA